MNILRPMEKRPEGKRELNSCVRPQTRAWLGILENGEDVESCPGTLENETFHTKL